jgi:hypothetical protein
MRPLLLVLLLCSTLVNHAFGQDRNAVMPPGSIDGSRSPELIPDVVAFRLFFSALAESPQTAALVPGTPEITFSAPEPSARQRAILYPVQLGDGDQRILVQAASDFKDRLVNATAVNSAASPAPEGAAQSRLTLDEIAQSAVTALKSKMSPDGFQRLQTFVQGQKRYMKRVPYPQTTGHPH